MRLIDNCTADRPAGRRTSKRAASPPRLLDQHPPPSSRRPPSHPSSCPLLCRKRETSRQWPPQRTALAARRSASSSRRSFSFQRHAQRGSPGAHVHGPESRRRGALRHARGRGRTSSAPASSTKTVLRQGPGAAPASSAARCFPHATPRPAMAAATNFARRARIALFASSLIGSREDVEPSFRGA